MRLEVVVVPVADVDRAKNFYQAPGWREDADRMGAAGSSRRSPPAFWAGDSGPVITGLVAGVTVLDRRGARMQASFDSAADLAEALRRPGAAHGRHEEQIGHPDPDWPDWYARYMVREQAGNPGQAGPGAGA